MFETRIIPSAHNGLTYRGQPLKNKHPMLFVRVDLSLEGVTVGATGSANALVEPAAPCQRREIQVDSGSSGWSPVEELP